MTGKLKPIEVARQVAPGKYPDGDGLYLIVAGPTSRNWSYRYWVNGKERWHGLGSVNEVSLKDARIKRDAARQEVHAGVDVCRPSDRLEKRLRLSRPTTYSPPPFRDDERVRARSRG